MFKFENTLTLEREYIYVPRYIVHNFYYPNIKSNLI